MKIDETELRARLDALSLEEKVGLLTGVDFWTLRPIERIGLARLVLSDGPNGVRGTTWDERETSLLFPNTSALAATWDPAAAEATGRLTGAQARDKGVHVLLAPTVNLHRTPLGGRHFECYSEDPLLTSRMAAAFIAGVQSAGVAATIKHFVANDSETARMTYDARISEAALRELYLRPFEDAVKGGVWAVMAAYNSVNGSTMTENHPLLTKVLKQEWGFDGAVVSDWFAVRSTEAAATGGTDLEMPGTPGAFWGGKLVEAVRSGKVAEELIDDKALRVLRLAARTGALRGFPVPEPVTTPADARDRLRALAAQAAVLLRNDGMLPLSPSTRIALIGPNALRFGAQGGGSAHVNPEHVVTPAEGLSEVFPRLTVHPGVFPHRVLPPLDIAPAHDPQTGEPGFRVEYLAADASVLGSENRRAAKLILMGTLPEGTHEIVLRTVFTAPAAGRHVFAVAGAGPFHLTVGEATDVVTLVTRSGDPIEALVSPGEHRIEVELEAGEQVTVEAGHTLTEPMFAIFGLGHEAPRLTDDEEIAAAVAAAREAEVAVVVVGTNDEVESEGTDRETLALPGRQDELVSKVAAANPRTVVVVNAGAPVLMPWQEEVAAVLWAWLPGQEGGGAIADVLSGAAEPGGRLPTTFPATETGLLPHVPVDGVLDYAEGTSIGYRHYPSASVAFPFGHGLGYTTWSYESVIADGEAAVVTVRNTGGRRGREVIQCYLGAEPRLAGFATVAAEPGESVTVRIALDRRAGTGSGSQPLHVGHSIANLPMTTEVTL